MATTSAHSAPSSSSKCLPRASPEQAADAVFTLSAPIKIVSEGQAVEIHGFDMRAFNTSDLPMLDRFHGQPIALAQNLIAALCTVSIECVHELELEDFTMLAADALFQVDQVSQAMGLPAHFFAQPRSMENANAWRQIIDAPPR